MQTAHPGAVRFHFAQFFRLHESESRNAVCNAALMQLFDSCNLGLRSGEDNFSADLAGDSMLFTKGNHGRRAFDAHARLERSRFVIDPRMDDTAIMSGLVLGQLALLLQHHQAELWQTPSHLHCHRETNNTTADNCYVEALVRHSLKMHWNRRYFQAHNSTRPPDPRLNKRIFAVLPDRCRQICGSILQGTFSTC